MKNVQLIFCVIFAFLFIGCHSPHITQSERFPEAFVGTWLNEDIGWLLKFEGDGQISKILREDGLEMDIEAGGKIIKTEDQQVFLIYVLGDCVWSYHSEERLLKAILTIEDFYLRSQDSELSCKQIDELEGPVSDDGKAWKAVWTTTTKWHDGAPDQIVSGRELILFRTK